MHGKRSRAQEYEEVSFCDGKTFRDTEKIHPRCRENHADPHLQPNAFSQKDPHNRNDYYVQRCNKSCLSSGRIYKPDLLERASRSEGKPAADTSDDQILPAANSRTRDFRHLFLALLPAISFEKQEHRDQHNSAHQAADGIKSKRP